MSDKIALKEEMVLVEKAKSDEMAFTQLYNFYFLRIYNFINKRVSHRETAEDLVSETFMKAFANLNKYNYKGLSFGAWLYKIASNLVIDYYRKELKYKKEDIDDHPSIPSNLLTDEEIKIKQDKDAVEKLLAHLPDREKQIIELKFFAELSNNEIAEIMDITATNVGVLIFRSLKKCQKYLN